MTQIEILRQEPNWLAVNKPAGISVHNEDDSLNLLKALSAQLGIKPLLPVHRLDKETSGLQLLALDPKTAAQLAAEFQGRRVDKLYQGVVAGQLEAQGRWTDPLTDQAEGQQNPAGRANDRIDCETSFKVHRTSPYFSWVEFQIHTGRQHQIRKHCALHGRALIGDPRYGNPKYNLRIAKMYAFDRMALHASQIRILGFEIRCPAPVEFNVLFPDSL